jgi:NitT/TauT family transport system permease protein
MKWRRFTPQKAHHGAWQGALLALMMAVLVFGGWEAAVWLFAIPKIVLPPPSAIVLSLWQAVQSAEFHRDLLVTLWEIVAGFALGSLGGLLLGFLVALSPLAERLVYPYVVAFQTLPKVAVAPIIVIWFGYGLSSKIIITATIAFFPLLANTIMGLRAAPADQVEMLVSCTASRWQVFRMVRVMAALPYIFVGLDVAIVLSVIGAIVGEFVGAKAGLGYLLMQKNFNFDMAGTFAILVVLSLIGIVLHAIVQAVQRRVIFWMNTTGERPVSL